MPAIAFVLVWMFLIRPMAAGPGAGGLMAIGKSKAKVYVEKASRPLSPMSPASMKQRKNSRKSSPFLKDPASYGRLGARMFPRACCWSVRPGPARRCWRERSPARPGSPFFSISGSEFVEMFVGVGAARVRDLFEQARQHAPAIVFIDELDALGRARGTFFPGGGGHDEKEQTLNQLLSELDGFDPTTGVVLLAATNRPEILDPALLRAGRFDRQVSRRPPRQEGPGEIFSACTSKDQARPDVPVEDIAALTPGFTGADLANLVNEAALWPRAARATA